MTAPTPRRMAELFARATEPGSHFKQQGSMEMGVRRIQCLILLHNASRKPDKLSGFAMSFLCGIKYLAQKTGQFVRFLLHRRLSACATGPLKHKNRT
jgi:hypothetical protein